MALEPLWFAGNSPKKYEKLLVFDRDGTLNVDTGYTHKVENLELTYFAKKLISRQIFENVNVAVASNQSGIGRGLYSAQDFVKFTLTVLNRIQVPDNSIIGIAACSHKPSDFCRCRKPNTGMIELITSHHETKRIIVIGNEPKDRLLAENSKLPYIDSNSEAAIEELLNWRNN